MAEGQQPPRVIWVSSDAKAASQQARQFWGRAVAGCLGPDCSLGQLVDAIRTVSRGSLVISSVLLHSSATLRRSRQGEYGEAATVFAQLSHRQRQVLAYICQGMTSTAIANRLDIGVETIRTHAQQVLDKLALPSRVQAMVLVVGNPVLQDLLAAYVEEDNVDSRSYMFRQ